MGIGRYRHKNKGFVKSDGYYPERIILFDLTHTMSIVDPVTIDVETLRIDSGCSLEKEFIELIYMNH